MTKRDEFSARTKKDLAIRAAHFCSNPSCLKLTAGPHSDENRSLSTGHAAHIHAAAIGGPRYSAQQTASQRRAITNGIWLCRECGDIVDKDTSLHGHEILRQWKENHEAMLVEIRTQGYSKSLELLQSSRREPALAKKVIAILEDRRALWETFDAEFPDRVRRSLDFLRSQLVEMRGDIPDKSPMDQILLSMTKTILAFFQRVNDIDLDSLRCDSNDPEWTRFKDALAALRKSVGFQIDNLAAVYGISLSADLKGIVPKLI